MKKILVLAAMSAITMSGFAKTTANDSLVENYARSSIYTILLKSDTQNKHYEQETKNAGGGDELINMAKGFAGTDAKKAANETESGSIFELPAVVFETIEIPNQFNDHNLDIRIIDFDAAKAKVTDAEKEQYAHKKKGGFNIGGFAKSMAGMSTAGDDINADFDAYEPAVLAKFFQENHVPEALVAKWFSYNPNNGTEKWGIDVIEDRGSYNFSEADLKEAANDPALRAKIEQTKFDLIGNTYVLATNLRFRSYQAIVDEISKAAGGAKGMGLLGTIASVAAGDGYTVQAVSSLYRLKWDEDKLNTFEEEIYGKNGTLEDLIAAGICELEYLGTEKSSSNIRQSLFSEKPISDLVKRATARAIDQAIIKLQTNHEEFRTKMPVIGGDGNGIIYARIGTKEGLNEKDEYEILEKQEDKNGKTIYKSVGTVKPVKGKIWNNAYGAEEELAENSKATDEDKENVTRGYSEFQGKKGDYRGHYLRLKKKK